MRNIIDTNILTRYFTGDNKKLSATSTEILAKEKVYVSFVTILELNYVLLGNTYKYSKKEVLEALGFLIKAPSIKIPKSFPLCYEIYKDTTLSLADCYLIAISKKSKLYTFDKKLVKECKARKAKVSSK